MLLAVVTASVVGLFAGPVAEATEVRTYAVGARTFTLDEVRSSWWPDATCPWRDPSDRLVLRGLMFLRTAIPGADAAELQAMVALALAQSADNPDRASSRDGWDEGTSLRRLEVLNQLYSRTHDERLVALMTAEVAVQFGPRYYGPPYHRVHNHGLMANLAVLKAADLLGRTEWRARVVARIRREAPHAFSPQGATYEQSSGYQLVNAALWRLASDAIGGDATIETYARRAERVGQILTEPDGRITVIGDTNLSPKVSGATAAQAIGDPRLAAAVGDPDLMPMGGDVDLAPAAGDPATVPRLFRDDSAGYTVGRFGPDRDASYYVVRTGPPRAMHGHEERSGVTWSTRGVRVVNNAGLYSYDSRSAYQRWSKTSPWSANVAIPSGRPFVSRGSSRVVGGKAQWIAHAWLVEDRLYGITHRRRVQVIDPTATLNVTDTYPKGRRLTQVWHLAPQWRVVRAPRATSTLVFAHPDGRRLVVRTTGVVASMRRGATRGPAGWVFPAMHERVPAWQFHIIGTTSVRTSFTVS